MAVVYSVVLKIERAIYGIAHEEILNRKYPVGGGYYAHEAAASSVAAALNAALKVLGTDNAIYEIVKTPLVE